MQEFFTAESEEASKVSQNKDDLKLLFYGKNIYFYSLKFAKVHRKMAIDSFYRCGSQILSESENFPPLGFFSSNNHSIKILRGDICHQSAQCPLSPRPNSISFVTTFFFLSQVIKRPRTNHRPGAEVSDQSGICGIQHSRWGHMTIKKTKDFYMN